MTPEEITLYGPPVADLVRCVTTYTHSRCSDCLTWKELARFSKSKYRKTGTRNICKACARLRAREWGFKKKYGITVLDFDKMLAEQGGACLVCGTKDSGRTNSLVLCVDHDHKTGKVRGLLCHNCNVAIGSMQDNPALLRKAAEYLER